ncbi:MAG: aminomethyltransferase family protein [Phycisphaerae bacterium]
MHETEDTANLPLHGRHEAMEAKFADESGWRLPLVYSSVLDEVDQAHSAAALLDVTPLSRFRIRGNGAVDFLERLFTHDAVRQEDNTAELTCLCNRRGGVIDCGYLLRLESDWLYTGDAGNRAKTAEHFQLHAADFDIKLDDQTDKTCQLAAIGPDAAKRLDAILPEPISPAPRGQVRVGNYLVARIVASRTSYCGLWGLEVILPKMLAGQAWTLMTQRAGDNAIDPIGHAARDVLRIEAGLARYGHEINEMIDPITAGLGRCVRLNHDCIGAEALGRIEQQGPARRLVQLRFEAGGSVSSAGRIPRMGESICDEQGNQIGQVTSGTYSPGAAAVVALGLVQSARTEAGPGLQVGDTHQPARLIRTIGQHDGA